jgi:3-hydroxyacyl-CoA dehydrogenase / 3-hydroxy-2-methylbutyryl-CoA dehydrogenase
VRRPWASARTPPIPEQVAAAIKAAVDRFGTIDINVNTAGIQGFVPLIGPDGPTDVADFTRLWNTNVVGTFNVMSRAAAVMLDNEPDEDGERGVIINTSSVAGQDGTAGMLGYAATKAALIGMTLPAAREFAGRGIRVNTIIAGGFDTPILDVTGRAGATGLWCSWLVVVKLPAARGDRGAGVSSDVAVRGAVLDGAR